MQSQYAYQSIPKSRIATFDVFSVALSKHHVTALIEFDVTTAREKIRALRKQGKKLSFNAYLIKQIACAVKEYPEVAAFLCNKHKLIVFEDVNVSLLIEKQIDNKKVPMPYVIMEVNEKSVEEITLEIEAAKNEIMGCQGIVVGKKGKWYEQLYYYLPAFVRRFIWRLMLKYPQKIYGKMGNVSVTSLGMMGVINGWFLHTSVHPLSFGIGSIIKKPVVVDKNICIRDILNVTVLLDHDVIDGAPMVRFIKRLKDLVENPVDAVFILTKV